MPQSDSPLQLPLDDGFSDATPVMGQYLATKAEHPDALLFFRMGDFYELFFDDAVKAAEALDITLTKRGKFRGQDIPMCGVPVHTCETYIARAIRAGFKVAICEQKEDPQEARRKRGYKAVVERGVERIITPGTLVEETLLDAKRANYLAAVVRLRGAFALAWADVSTGELGTQPIETGHLFPALARLSPLEIILSETLYQDPELKDLSQISATITPLANAVFESETARKRLEELFGVASLDGFGAFGRAEIAALGALIDYVCLTQAGKRARFSPPKRVEAADLLEIDPSTRRSLELTETLTGTRKGSLLACIDRTVTGSGARLLAEWVSSPLTDPKAIHDRLDAVEVLVNARFGLTELRVHLAGCPDMARALGRLSLGRGGPRDLGTIRDGLKRIPTLRASVRSTAGADGPSPALQQVLHDMGEHATLTDTLDKALSDELPVFARDGGFVRQGYALNLDELRCLRDESQRLIAALQLRYAAETKIPTLKIKHNNVLGYFVEVPAARADALLKTRAANGAGQEDTLLTSVAPRKANTVFTHRQTLANQVRFTTVELSELEDRLRGAADKALALEMEIFRDLCARVAAEADAIVKAGAALARLDVFQGLANLAESRGYTRPHVDTSVNFTIRNGRHPVVETALTARGESRFVGNDCDLSPERRLWLLTGPNMAGKSTFLRQNALIVILAQMGSFVPADEARIGVVDRLFSRVGAADDLARGRSTFMVEMVETAAILNQATDRSLVILDEIGRGTATFDGLSIAWATVESLHDVTRCRALFATHYHELTALAARLDHLSCHTLRVKEWKGEVIFLHEVGEGTADRSYGIHVARLAGLPAAVVHRAEEVLHSLESGDGAGAAARMADALPLFTAEAPGTPAPAAGNTALEQALADLKPDDLSPRDALETLYRLKALAEPAA